MRKLHWSLLKRIYRLLPRYMVYERLKRRWLLDNRNWVDQQLIIRKPYEVAQIEKCRELVERHRITRFLDIGANFGLYSVLLSDCPSIKSIDAFEPLPRNVNQLAANLYLNGLDPKVSVHAFALGESDARAALFVDSNSTGVSTINPETVARERSAYGACVEVQVHALDTLFDIRDEAVLVKIDVEAAELEVLAGMRQFLSANRVWLQIETIDETKQKVDDYMQQLDYSSLGRIGADSYYGRRSA